MATPCESGRRWTRAVKITLCLFFLIPMSSVGIRNTNTIFGEKQKLEVQQQLKRLNKPALKTIKSPDGDIIDCVDIKKQLAFDYPLLKNHTIQMRPSFYPEGLLLNESNVSSNSKHEITQLWHLNGRCPEGTIPIRRIKEEDLLRASSIANHRRKKYNITPHDDDDDNAEEKHEHAVFEEEGSKYFGMNAEMSIWNPYVDQASHEFSLSQFWIEGAANSDEDNIDTIEAGWMVYKGLFNDYESRFFTFWTNDGYQHSHYNLDGFVQVDTTIALGASFASYSVYGGSQHSLNFFVYKDLELGHWWLQVGRYQLGYWPAYLFSVLNAGAIRVSWGGEVVNQNSGGQHTTTKMGSGHFAEEGPFRASYFKNLKVIDADLILREPSNSRVFATRPNCYNILKLGDDSFYYGGPGRNPNCP